MSVHARGQEHAGSGGAPHAVGEGTGVVGGPHDGALLNVLAPYSSGPVSDAKEELGVEGVAREGVDRSMVSRECHCYLVRGVLGFTITATTNITIETGHSSSCILQNTN